MTFRCLVGAEGFPQLGADAGVTVSTVSVPRGLVREVAGGPPLPDTAAVLSPPEALS